VVVVTVTTGCCSKPIETILIPLEHEYSRIGRKPYKVGYQDCSNLSAEYAVELDRKGYEAAVQLLHLNGGGNHAVVRVVTEQGVVFIDPLWRRSTNCIWDWGFPYKRIAVRNLNNAVYGDEFRIR
jgi:hypothetical protein